MSAVLEWTEQQRAFRAPMRRFVDAEIRPRLDEFEQGVPRYDVLRKLLATFGIVELARARFAARIAREKEAALSERAAAGDDAPDKAARLDAGPVGSGVVTAIGPVAAFAATHR